MDTKHRLAPSDHSWDGLVSSVLHGDLLLLAHGGVQDPGVAVLSDLCFERVHPGKGETCQTCAGSGADLLWSLLFLLFLLWGGLLFLQDKVSL